MKVNQINKYNVWENIVALAKQKFENLSLVYCATISMDMCQIRSDSNKTSDNGEQYFKIYSIKMDKYIVWLGI